MHKLHVVWLKQSLYKCSHAATFSLPEAEHAAQICCSLFKPLSDLFILFALYKLRMAKLHRCVCFCVFLSVSVLDQNVKCAESFFVCP